jgi:hypothetical protein
LIRLLIVYTTAICALTLWPALVLVLLCCCRPSVQQLMEIEPELIEGGRRGSPGRVLPSPEARRARPAAVLRLGRTVRSHSGAP